MSLFDLKKCARFAVLAAFIIIPQFVVAQAAERKGGPESGTWAAEASTGGTPGGLLGQSAAILRFLSPKAALIGDFSFSHSDGDASLISAGNSSAVSLRAGVRSYMRSGLGLRPIVGGGVLFSRQSFGTAKFNAAGAYGEAGAAWFFNPHVSLGALGSLSAVNGNDRWTVGGSIARLTATVYF
jgi:hypothetical protein